MVVYMKSETHQIIHCNIKQMYTYLRIVLCHVIQKPLLIHYIHIVIHPYSDPYSDPLYPLDIIFLKLWILKFNLVAFSN